MEHKEQLKEHKRKRSHCIPYGHKLTVSAGEETPINVFKIDRTTSQSGGMALAVYSDGRTEIGYVPDPETMTQEEKDHCAVTMTYVEDYGGGSKEPALYVKSVTKSDDGNKLTFAAKTYTSIREGITFDVSNKVNSENIENATIEQKDIEEYLSEETTSHKDNQIYLLKGKGGISGATQYIKKALATNEQITLVDNNGISTVYRPTIPAVMKIKGTCLQVELPDMAETGDTYILQDLSPSQYSGQMAIWLESEEWAYTKATMDIDTVLSDESSNPVENRVIKRTIEEQATLFDEKLDEKLSLTGGELSGDLSFDTSHAVKVTDNSNITIQSSEDPTYGASLKLHGVADPDETMRGSFEITPVHGDLTGEGPGLEGHADGRLLWNKKPIATTDAIAETVMQTVYDGIFPVGTYYLNVAPPNVPHGVVATWVVEDTIDGCYIYIDHNQTPGTTFEESAEIAGHTLTISETPKHAHNRGSMNISGTVGHVLCPTARDSEWVTRTGCFSGSSKWPWGYNDLGGGTSWGAKDITFNANSNWSGVTNYVGADQPHNHTISNIKPKGLYVTVWRRTE